MCVCINAVLLDASDLLDAINTSREAVTDESNRQQLYRSNVGERIRNFIKWERSPPALIPCERDGQCLLHVLVHHILAGTISLYRWRDEHEAKKVVVTQSLM